MVQDTGITVQYDIMLHSVYCTFMYHIRIHVTKVQTNCDSVTVPGTSTLEHECYM